MANKRTYTNEELAYIKRYYPTCNTQLIADELGWTERKVKRVAIYHGFHKKVHHSKKAPKVRPYKACDDYSFKPTGKPIVIPNPQPSDYINSNRGNLCELSYPTDYTYKGRIYKETDLHPLEADCYEHYEAVAAKYNAMAPKRPNLFQRIIGFLLRGDW